MRIAKSFTHNIILTCVYFLLSTVITWWFIKRGELLYLSSEKMILSCSIAGAKWGMQIIVAIIFLKETKWLFIKRIAFTCFAGSCMLLPYCVLRYVRTLPNSFLISVAGAVCVMIYLYYKAVMHTQISKIWFWGWLICLVIAVSLQVVIVFHYSYLNF